MSLSRGVGERPHRGFETVTIVYQGELEHRDSTGAGGLIGPGDMNSDAEIRQAVQDFQAGRFGRMND